MSTSILSAEAVRRALSIRDLTDPAQGKHAMQHLVDECVQELSRVWGCSVRRQRSSPPAASRDAREDRQARHQKRVEGR
jgi:phenylalanyl-tRNA synthetase alpha chain